MPCPLSIPCDRIFLYLRATPSPTLPPTHTLPLRTTSCANSVRVPAPLPPPLALYHPSSPVTPCNPLTPNPFQRHGCKQRRFS